MDFKDSLQQIKDKMKKTTAKLDSIELDNCGIYIHHENYMKPYNTSEKEAIAKGFEEVEDNEAYNGRYFIKDGLIWIHNIQALKSKLGIYDEDELRYMNYDVDTYYDQNSSISIPSNKLRLYDDKDGDGNCAFDFENMVYLGDGVYIHEDDCWF